MEAQSGSEETLEFYSRGATFTAPWGQLDQPWEPRAQAWGQQASSRSGFFLSLIFSSYRFYIAQGQFLTFLLIPSVVIPDFLPPEARHALCRDLSHCSEWCECSFQSWSQVL